jgi:hypothetical protein
LVVKKHFRKLPSVGSRPPLETFSQRRSAVNHWLEVIIGAVVAGLCALIGLTPFFLKVIFQLGRLVTLQEGLALKGEQQDGKITKLEELGSDHRQKFVRVFAWLWAIDASKAPPA